MLSVAEAEGSPDPVREGPFDEPHRITSLTDLAPYLLSGRS